MLRQWLHRRRSVSYTHLGEIDETLKELFPKERLDFKEILIGVLSGDITFSAQLLKQLVKEQFSYAFASSRQNLIHILMLAIMTAVFTNFARAFGNGQAADTGFYVMYLMIVALCLNSCQIIMDWVEAVSYTHLYKNKGKQI